MATATAYYSVNMDTGSVWYGDVTIANSNQIQIANGGYVQNYYGSFSYNAYGLTGGNVTSTNYFEFGYKIYDITGGSYSVLTINSYLDAGNMSGLLSFIFSGNDTFNGSAQGDALNGFVGDDNIRGNGGNDLLKGGSGNDILNGGTGADTMLGGSGNDTYYVDNTADKVFETTTTAGTTDAGGNDTVYSYLASYTLGSYVENGRILSTGTASLTGNTLNNVLYAGSGNNVLNGSTGTDTASFAYAGAAVTASLAITAAQATGGSGSDTLLNIENLIGSNYNDSLTGNTLANTLTGGLGNDVLNGGAGNDVMIGGDGSDTYYVQDTGDVVSETNATASTGGTDHVHSYLSAYTLGANVENGRILSTGTASLTGNSLNNVLYAGSGNNVLNGSTGTDTASFAYAGTAVTASLATTAAQATGGSGSDTLLNVENLTGSNYNDSLTGNTLANTLNGGLGNDVLNGGSGNDIMIGGVGKDSLIGGGGNDLFDFNALSEMGTTSTTWDVITDFTRGYDKIDLSTLDANTGTAANDAFSGIMIASTAGFTAAGQLKLVSGILYGNTDADATPEFAIQLAGISALNATDFVL